MAEERYSRHLLRMARRKAGLTQAELARRARTSQSAVSAYESGRRSPSMDTLVRLVEAAGLEIRVRLAEPDLHDLTRQRGETLLAADELASFTKRERSRLADRPGHG